MHWLTEWWLFARSLWWTFWAIVGVIMIGVTIYIIYTETRE